MAQWKVDTPNFYGGLVPCYWESDYPTEAVGNPNQAGKVSNIDLTSPFFVCQGAGLANLTNGTEAGSVTDLVKNIIDYVVASDTTYGISTTKVHKISPTTVINSGGFPHAITDATSGQGIAYYHGDIFYSYNKAAAGDVGMYDVSGDVWDDDWGSTIPTGATALQATVPHPVIAAGNDFLYIGNGYYITSYDGTTFTEQDLDLPSDAVIQDFAWNLNRLVIAANRPDISGSKNIASLYIWDGNSTSWEDEITVRGEVSKIYVKNNELYVFWKDASGKARLGILDNGAVRDLALWDGTLPEFYQVTDYKNFILWASDGLIWAWGAADATLPPQLFQIADGGYATVGALACPFSVPLIGSTESTSFKLAKFSGYDTSSYWRSRLYNAVTDDSDSSEGMVDKLIVNFEKLTSGARADISLVDPNGTELWTGAISYASDGAIHQKVFKPTARCAAFRIHISYSNGGTSATVKIKSIRVIGHDTEI
jgi:hypothetical protein